MYSIGYVIYGIPLSEEGAELINEWEADENEARWFEDKEGACGFTTVYDGSAGYQKGWCGVKLDSFDVCDDIELNKFMLKIGITDEVVAAAEDRIANLDSDLRATCGEMGLWVVWGTS